MTIICPQRDDLIVIYEIIKKDAESVFGKQSPFGFRELQIILDAHCTNTGIGQVSIDGNDPSILIMYLPDNLDLKQSIHVNLFAHEVVHTLRHTGAAVTKLEEGAATWFGKQYAERLRPQYYIILDVQKYIDVYNSFSANKDILLGVIKDKFNDENATFSSFDGEVEVVRLGLNIGF